MSRSASIVPDDGEEVHLVLDDFGARHGRAWREAFEEETDIEALLRDLMDGQYSNPVRVVCFSVTEGWARDVSQDVADELWQRCVDRGQLPESIQEFLARHKRKCQESI